MDMKDFVNKKLKEVNFMKCNYAFILDRNKVEEFRNQKGMSEKVLERYYAHQPKPGVEVKVHSKNVRKNKKIKTTSELDVVFVI